MPALVGLITPLFSAGEIGLGWQVPRVRMSVELLGG
jgi:hypothetical protein